MVYLEREEWHLLSIQKLVCFTGVLEANFSNFKEMEHYLPGFTKAEDGSLYCTIRFQDGGAPEAGMEMKPTSKKARLSLLKCPRSDDCLNRAVTEELCDAAELRERI